MIKTKEHELILWTKDAAGGFPSRRWPMTDSFLTGLLEQLCIKCIIEELAWEQKIRRETLGVRGDGGLDTGRGHGGDSLGSQMRSGCSLKGALR